MTLLQLLTLRVPFHNVAVSQALEMIKSDRLPYIPDFPSSPSHHRVSELVRQCLMSDPSQRPTAERLILAFFWVT
jgi:serine/threonine protein kinase